MKKMIITLFVLAILFTPLLSNSTLAQGIFKGVKVCMNLASVRGDSVENTNTYHKLGLAIGGYLTFKINEKFAVQPEFLYSMKGHKFEEGVPGIYMKVITSTNYIEIPILGLYSIQDDAKLFAGPSFGFYLNGEVEVEMSVESSFFFFDTTFTEDIKSDDVYTPDFGLIFGGSLTEGKITVELRYYLGLKNVFKEKNGEPPDIKNTVIQLMVGYSF
ncbi:PorT family protein [candidate division KSB1 bacterium]|nr:PorT family protein [candidate division KSB1 bacterium]